MGTSYNIKNIELGCSSLMSELFSPGYKYALPEFPWKILGNSLNKLNSSNPLTLVRFNFFGGKRFTFFYLKKNIKF